MQPKGNKRKIKRPSRPPKRKFGGNQFTDKDGNPLRQSTTARKLSTSTNEDLCITPAHFYRIIEFMTVFGTLSQFLICKTCTQAVQFKETGHRGLGFKLVVECRCGQQFINSSPFINNSFEINRRIVFVMRLLGIGRDGLNLFCGLMDIGTGLSKNMYGTVVEHIYTAVKAVFNALCLKVVKEEREQNLQKKRASDNFIVSGDGSWKKLGFTSLYGVTSLIAYYTGKIIDVVVKSSYCQACTVWSKKHGTDEYKEWLENHEEECAANHNDSADKMEVIAITEMFTASQEKYGVKYGNYIGDGGSKTFKAIIDLNPYGNNFPVIKSECIDYIEKRMESRLRNVKETKKLGEKLTDILIKKLSKYYGFVIRNTDSVENMKRDIMATYLHIISTNKNPRHENCPKGKDTWCKYNLAQISGAKYDHPAPLHPEVTANILPIYEDFSREELLERCLGGYTQNANEIYNSTVWRLAPKHIHAGHKIVEIAAFIAACIFNEGFFGVLKIMETLEIKIGTTCKMFADSIDVKTKRQECRSSISIKAQLAQKQQLLEQNEIYEEAEGLLYGSGIAN